MNGTRQWVKVLMESHDASGRVVANEARARVQEIVACTPRMRLRCLWGQMYADCLIETGAFPTKEHRTCLDTRPILMHQSPEAQNCISRNLQMWLLQLDPLLTSLSVESHPY